MPNRIIKESINESVSLADVTPFAQDLYKRLITYADDYGRFNASPDMILARLFPRELSAVSADDIRLAIVELIGEGKIKVYRASASASRWRGDVEFGFFPGWDEHQRIRMAKHKNPDPENDGINDLYLRRFIPKELKVEVFERDKAVCQCCKKDFSLPGIATDRAMRLLSSVLHFDHIVPVFQGGRATLENLRLTCASCNQSRPKKVEASEIAAICGKPPQEVAKRGKLPSESNPIQSESNPNPIQSTEDFFSQAWNAYPKRPGASRRNALKAWEARIKAGVSPSTLIDGVEKYASYCVAMQIEPKFIKSPETFFGPGEHYLSDWTPAQGNAHGKNGSGRGERISSVIAELTGRASSPERVINGIAERVD